MRASQDSTFLTKMHTKKNFHRNGPKASCLTPTLRMHNVLIEQKGHKTKEERGKRKEKEKYGKKHKSNNIQPLKCYHTWRTCTMLARRIIIRPKSTNSQHRVRYHSQKHKRGRDNGQYKKQTNTAYEIKHEEHLQIERERVRAGWGHNSQSLGPLGPRWQQKMR